MAESRTFLSVCTKPTKGPSNYTIDEGDLGERNNTIRLEPKARSRSDGLNRITITQTISRIGYHNLAI